MNLIAICPKLYLYFQKKQNRKISFQKILFNLIIKKDKFENKKIEFGTVYLLSVKTKI